MGPASTTLRGDMTEARIVEILGETMMRDDLNRNGHPASGFSQLTPATIAKLEQSLHEVGDYGEIHLVVKGGCLRFIRTVKSTAVSSEGYRNEG
jgi:hypothetical protein